MKDARCRRMDLCWLEKPSWLAGPTYYLRYSLHVRITFWPHPFAFISDYEAYLAPTSSLRNTAALIEHGGKRQ